MKFTSLTQRFAVWFTLVSLLPILFIGNSLLHTFEKEIKNSAIRNVSAIADKKIEQIDSYLKERFLDSSLVRDSSTTHEAIMEFSRIFEQSGVESDDYRRLDASYRENFKRFVEEAKYYDIFLISTKGDIVYTQAHESDFATNLLTGPYRDTGLGKVTRYALDNLKSSISDFERYAPSKGAIAAFVATPVIINGEIKGVLALQIFSERVFAVIANNVGLSDSGETVVARLEDDHSALVMAPLKYDPDAALKRRIPLNISSAEAMQNALKGNSGGALTFDYRGKEVVAAWGYLPLMKWGIVVHIDADEAFASVHKLHFVGLIILVLTLLAALFGAILFNRRVVDPLKHLNRSALEISAGNLHQRVAIEGWDEMRQLADTFNIMVERLNASDQERNKAEENLLQLNQQLENKVAVRTADLQRANVSLAVKEEEMRSVVEHMVDCVVTTDERGVILSANPVMEKLFGYSHDEMIGQNVSIIVPEPDRSKHDSYMENYCRTGHGQEYVGRPYLPGSHGIGLGREVEGVRKDGERIELYLAVSEYFVGGKRHFTGVMRDIREHVRMMKDLKQARIDAEQASRAKSSFLAAMSHEIRTPMNGVIGMIDVLRQTSLSGYQMEMANLIRDSAYALLSIIEDILDFSKIEAGKLEIEKIPMRLASVVENACGMLAHLALTKGVELTLFIDPGIPENVLGDPLRLRQVLVNIINNAIKFSSAQEKSGKVSVRVLLTESNPDQVVITFQINDNGIGMDKETQDKLFKSFSQGDPSTTRRFGGTGLGLAISHHLAELMDAEITVQSEPQQGSTFMIQMPFKPLPAITVPDSKLDDLSGLTCLILGDDNGMSDDLAIYLKSAGANVEQISDLNTVRQRIQSLAPGLWLVVIDAGQQAPSIEELRAAFTARSSAIKSTVKVKSDVLQPDIEPRFIVIKRGRRRQARTEDIDIVTLDGDVMYRQSLLRAMAIAAGRAEVSMGSAPSDNLLKSGPVPVSREEALRQGKLILVAEDNDINQKVIRQQLNLLGYAGDIANDGREALKRLQDCNYALLLTDLHMPEMDGFELTKAIRSGETSKKHIPIVALTANALKGEREHCLSAGMDDYLSKPVQLEDLRLTLEKYLPNGKPAEEPKSVSQLSAAMNGAKSIIAPVNVHVLEELIGNDPEMIKEMLLDFRASSEKIATELHAAYRTGQFAAVGSFAHKLKSSARSVGALALGELCAEMEQAAKNNDSEALAVLLPSFDVQLMSVKAYLEALHAEG
ncbi:MAG: ATP-binding protein [Nitrosomonas sp.]|uniref:ATP-binding protein n=1 Tax=Nitrosomonas sp. TaxID=42353 RepID=UPI00272459F6|nr:ATP-binding protein [Nitrosomonas sp.]MDO8893919.1 ATP-binding protein [Nitrosomonas sp.]MDO9470167.1 ATP-binding protein [Nitrosomonas sp.]MDP1786549.1 ATP-binding protein [Nitrosomonas sp.]